MHTFLCYERNGVMGMKRERETAFPVHLKHFKTDCFVLEGLSYRDVEGIPAKKQLTRHATHYIYSLTENGFMVVASNGPSALSQTQTSSERRQHKSVSKLMQDASSTHGYY